MPSRRVPGAGLRRLFSPRLVSFLSLIVVALMACQAVSRAWQAPLILSTAVPSPTRTPQPLSPTPPPTFTPAPTFTPTPGPTSTSRPTPAPHHLAVFQELWTIVSEEYLYPDYNGLDWDAVYQEVWVRVVAGLSSEDFYLAMADMIARLGDDHSYFLDPVEAAEEDAEYAGELEYVGIGVMVVPVPQQGRAMVLLTFPGSPAEGAGLLHGDAILAVDGRPILARDGFLRDVIRGPEGSSVLLTVQSPGGPPRQLTLERTRIRGPVPVPFRVLHTPAGRAVGYLLLPSFTDRHIPGQVEEALKQLTAQAGLSGIVLDNRWNYGGADTVLRGTLRYFTDGLVGFFANREGRRPVRVPGEDVRGSHDLPLVVLIGKDTASFGEVFAGVLQDLGRAYLIGRTTPGNVEILWGYDFSDGSRAWIAHDTFAPANSPGQDWEANGVVPDLEVPVPAGLKPLTDDPAVSSALDYLDQNASP